MRSFNLFVASDLERLDDCSVPPEDPDACAGEKQYVCEAHYWYGTRLSTNGFTEPAPCPRCEAEE
jgi:hypothetical protein